MSQSHVVLLPWGEYHRLQSHPAVCVYASCREALEAREDTVDEILPCRSPLDAARAAAAFRRFAWAAWTPNQDGPTQDANGHRMLVAGRILGRLRDRAEGRAGQTAVALPLGATLPA